MFIRSFPKHASWFVLCTVCACQHAAVAPASPPAPAVSVAQVAPPASESSATKEAAAEAATADASPFVEGVRLGYAARLDVAGQSTFLTTEKLLLGLHDDAVRLEPALLEGLARGRSQFPRVFGNLPESGWALQTSYAERTTRSSLSRWTGAEWVSADGLLQNKNVFGISPWSNGRTLLLLTSDYEKQLYFVQLGGARSGPLPALPRAAHDDYGCIRGIQPMAMSALPSGEAFLAGTRCSVSANEGVTLHGTVMNSWAPGQARAKVSVLPGLSEKEAASSVINSIVASSGTDVLVAGLRVPVAPEGAEAPEEAYLAHFDGKGWRAFSAPPIGGIEELQRAPDGKLWALFSGELWTTLGSASEQAVWQRVAMPKLASEAGENAVSSFWVQDSEQVWATVGSDGFSFLVRTKRGAAPLSAPSDQQVAQLSNAFDPMAAYECESPTLVLLTLSRQAPKDADMPSVRAALRGHSELEGLAQFIELPFLTRRYLGARGDMSTLLSIQEILSNARIPGVAPELRCLNEAPTRTLTLDFGGMKPDLPAAFQAPRVSASKRARVEELSY